MEKDNENEDPLRACGDRDSELEWIKGSYNRSLKLFELVIAEQHLMSIPP
jgi:hypothetical protein